MAVKVLLMSGGLDSVALAGLETFDVLLHVNTGTKDNWHEAGVVRRLFGDKFETVDMSWLARFELPNKIVPYRNHLLVLAAAQFGDDIAMAATAGDTTRDKDDVFALTLSAALTYFADGVPEKRAFGNHVAVRLPTRHLSKSQLVAQYLNRGWSPDRLIGSRSCYSGETASECGRCRSCLRKYCALAANGIEPLFDRPSRSIMLAHADECSAKGRDAEATEATNLMLTLEGDLP
jgi:7-cyano-7-deazaguanine synthase in queuosine biosynthesis